MEGFGFEQVQVKTLVLNDRDITKGEKKMRRHALGTQTPPPYVGRRDSQILIAKDAGESNEAAEEEARAILYGRIGGLRGLQLFLADSRPPLGSHTCRNWAARTCKGWGNEGVQSYHCLDSERLIMIFPKKWWWVWKSSSVKPSIRCPMRAK